MKKLILLLGAVFCLSAACANSPADAGGTEKSSTAKSGGGMNISITITNDAGETHTLAATLSDNRSADAFAGLLKKGSVTVKMHDYGSFEKVGPLGTTLPRTDTQITTQAGDIILYQGNQITIYYDTNSWNFTRLGKIRGVSQKELKAVLGPGSVTAVFSPE